jgi:hypothetical protein
LPGGLLRRIACRRVQATAELENITMKVIFTLAGAAALGIAGPALADPGHGHGHGHGHDRGDHYARTYHSSHYGRHDNGNHYGQMRRDYRHRLARLERGERYRSGYGTYYTYDRIPYRIRQQYNLNNDYRYYYNNGYLYAVNPRTMLIQQVISALLR